MMADETVGEAGEEPEGADRGEPDEVTYPELLQAEQLQQQIRERVGTQKEGLRADLNRLLATLDQNGMRKSAARDRMSDVARELDRLADVLAKRE